MPESLVGTWEVAAVISFLGINRTTPFLAPHVRLVRELLPLAAVESESHETVYDYCKCG